MGGNIIILQPERLHFSPPGTDRSSMTDRAVQALCDLGWTGYEASAYVALCSLGDATASTVAETSGVPRGKIYPVLKSLVQKGYCALREGSPTYYRAIDPLDLLAAVREGWEASFREATEALKEIRVEMSSRSLIWSLHSDRAIQARIRSMVRSAEETLVVITRSPAFTRPYVADLKRAHRQCTLHFIVDDRRNFAGTGLPIREGRVETYYLSGDMTVDGVTVRKEGMLIADWAELLEVLVIGGKRQAISSKEPAICHLYRRDLQFCGLLEE